MDKDVVYALGQYLLLQSNTIEQLYTEIGKYQYYSCTVPMYVWPPRFLKIGHPSPFCSIFGFFKQTSIQFYEKINVKKLAGIRAHDLHILSLIP